MSSTLLTYGLLTPLILIAVWFTTSSIITSSVPLPPNFRNKRIILLIAHPDDEAMFFSPTLLALTQPSLGNHLKILCLSTGDADGLGATRAQELVSSALTLGVRKKEDVFVMDDARFPDGMTNEWKAEDICRVLGQAFAPQIVSNSSTPSPLSSQTKSRTSVTSNTSGNNNKTTTSAEKESSRPSAHRRKSSKNTLSTATPKSLSKTQSSAPQSLQAHNNNEQPRATIDVLITFDAHGISSHPNHISLYNGSLRFLRSIMHGHHLSHANPVTLYTLATVNIVRKYSFFLDAIVTLLSGVVDAIKDGISGMGKKKSAGRDKASERVMFVNDVFQYWKARSAMVDGHKSQMRWFRYGWIGVGRYMVVNDLRRERVIY